MYPHTEHMPSAINKKNPILNHRMSCKLLKFKILNLQYSRTPWDIHHMSIHFRHPKDPSQTDLHQASRTDPTCPSFSSTVTHPVKQAPNALSAPHTTSITWRLHIFCTISHNGVWVWRTSHPIVRPDRVTTIGQKKIETVFDLPLVLQP